MKNKNLLFFLFILATIILGACQKEETNYEFYSTVSGKLLPGENFTADNYGEMQVLLAKLGEGINPETVTTKTGEMELIQSSLVSADGTFAFDSLEAGNYVVALSEGFIMAPDTFAVLTVDGEQSFTLEDKTVDRLPAENFWGSRIYLVSYNNKTKRIADDGKLKPQYELVSIEFYVDGSVTKTVTPEELDDAGKFAVKLDQDDNPQFVLKCRRVEDGEEFTSKKLHFFHSFSGSQQSDELFYKKEGFYWLKVEKNWLFGHIIELKKVRPGRMEIF
ncbi:MAG: carboxypeptidase-like regulatory domain-containing protein [Tangfeifania sp.]